jgi:hypothetical protein
MFNVTRIFADKNGESHFEDIVIPTVSMGDVGYLSEPQQVRTIQFREVGTMYNWDFHTAPDRQYIILLDGVIEIETSLGVKRKFHGGDVLLVEDVTGKGHKTRNIQKSKRKSVFVKL